MGSCGTCEADTPGNITLCHKDTNRLEQDLAEFNTVWEDLRLTIGRMDRSGPSVGGGGYGHRDPVNWDAHEKGEQLGKVLTGWSDAYGHPTPDPIEASRILYVGIRNIRKLDWASDLQDELRDAIGAARRAMDRAPNKVFAGMCPTKDNGAVCGTPLYARPGRPEVDCRACEATWDVTDWRARALIAAGMHQGTPAELSRMITDPVTGEALSQGRIRQWINRDKLAPIGRNAKGKAVYQVRKVRNLMERHNDKLALRLAA